MSTWKRSKSGLMKSSILKTHQNCEGSISLTLETRNSKKRSRMFVRNWKHQLLLICLAKLWWRIVEVLHPTKLIQDLRAFWMQVNLQDCVLENHYKIIMKTILQEEVKIHYSTTIWFTNLFPCLKLWKFLRRKQRWQGMGKIGENFGVGPDKSQKYERGDRWSKNERRKSSCFITDGHTSLEKCWIGRWHIIWTGKKVKN